MALSHADREEIANVVRDVVRSTVNGKIDKLDTKLQDHITIVMPYIQGISAFRLVLKIAGVIGVALVTFDQVTHIPVIRAFFSRL